MFRVCVHGTPPKVKVKGIESRVQGHSWLAPDKHLETGGDCVGLPHKLARLDVRYDRPKPNTIEDDGVAGLGRVRVYARDSARRKHVGAVEKKSHDILGSVEIERGRRD
jgi:hypothetical protein